MNMKKMNKLSVFILIAVITCMLCGCTSLFTKKDTLIFVQGANTSDSKTGMTAQVKITDFSEIYSGTLLDFYPQSADAVCVVREKAEDGSTLYSLILYDGDKTVQIAETDVAITEARLNVSTGDVYFKESNTATSHAALYMVDRNKNKKTKLTGDIAASSLAWTLTRDGTLIYADEAGVYKVEDGTATQLCALEENNSVKKIAYLKDQNAILMIMAVPQGANLFYTMDASTYELNAVDVNVSDFSASADGAVIAHLKTSAAGAKQLYTYNLSSGLRTYLFSSEMERISVSPDGQYIAYATEVTSQSTTQSIWVVNSANDVPVQLTANTTVTSCIFWDSEALRLLFSTRSRYRARRMRNPFI
jgi:Tol biopolymer transport system component